MLDFGKVGQEAHIRDRIVVGLDFLQFLKAHVRHYFNAVLADRQFPEFWKHARCQLLDIFKLVVGEVEP